MRYEMYRKLIKPNITRKRQHIKLPGQCFVHRLFFTIGIYQVSLNHTATTNPIFFHFSRDNVTEYKLSGWTPTLQSFESVDVPSSQYVTGAKPGK